MHAAQQLTLFHRDRRARRAFRKRLQDAGKPTKVALKACTRALLTILNAMFRNAEDELPSADSVKHSCYTEPSISRTSRARAVAPAIKKARSFPARIRRAPIAM